MSCGGVSRSLSQGQPHPPQADIGKSGDRKERYPEVLQNCSLMRMCEAPVRDVDSIAMP
jgi:hypothetical protein